MKKRFKIIYDFNETDPPKPHESKVAKIIAEYFESDVQFIRKTACSSPDIVVMKTHQTWEIKSPLGNGKRTISNNLRNASRQSKFIILDLSRCKMNNSRALTRINEYSKKGNPNIKKLLIIDKKGHVVDNILQIK
ncbi:hypothetical protein IJH72_02485 [Candidatus Saccharibacteria bacterium]|nr:hypothetical protein [Candidatus Saccharibacteria bacterium]